MPAQCLACSYKDTTGTWSPAPHSCVLQHPLVPSEHTTFTAPCTGRSLIRKRGKTPELQGVLRAHETCSTHHSSFLTAELTIPPHPHLWRIPSMKLRSLPSLHSYRPAEDTSVSRSSLTQLITALPRPSKHRIIAILLI